MIALEAVLFARKEDKTMEKYKFNNFAEIVTNRHSIRHFDTDVKISREELTQMISEATKAPSACNLQAWHFEVIDDEAGKEKLRSYFMKFNLPQVNSASAIVCVFGNTLAFKKYKGVWEKAYEDKQITKEKLNEILGTFLPLYEHAKPELLTADSLIDCGLVAMQFMLVARAHGYETNPMSGYDMQKAALTLGLDPTQYVPVMAIAIGKPEKGAHEVTTARYPVDDVLHFQ